MILQFNVPEFYFITSQSFGLGGGALRAVGIVFGDAENGAARAASPRPGAHLDLKNGGGKVGAGYQAFQAEPQRFRFDAGKLADAQPSARWAPAPVQARFAAHRIQNRFRNAHLMQTTL